MPGPDYVDLYLTVDPAVNTMQARYTVTINGVTSIRTDIGTPTSIPAGWFGGATGLAVAIISTSGGAGPEFPAISEFIEVTPVDGLPGQWQTLAPSSTNCQEVAYVNSEGKFYLAGDSTRHERYDPKTTPGSRSSLCRPT